MDANYFINTILLWLHVALYSCLSGLPTMTLCLTLTGVAIPSSCSEVFEALICACCIFVCLKDNWSWWSAMNWNYRNTWKSSSFLKEVKWVAEVHCKSFSNCMSLYMCLYTTAINIPPHGVSFSHCELSLGVSLFICMINHTEREKKPITSSYKMHTCMPTVPI